MINIIIIIQPHAEEEQGDVKASPKHTPVVSPM